MTALPIGTKLQNGAFTIGKILGQGGFGITYCGSDTRLNRVVAIKEFFPVGCTRVGLDVHSHGLFDVASYSNARAKFLQEAQSLAQFRHAGIVHVYTFCEENNTAYLVMEFLRGQTLSQLVESRGALLEKEAVEIIEEVCAAVEELHNQKTLHRDIKPDNIILCDDGRVVLIDFGLTKKVEETLGSSTRQLTATTRFGSDGFAPPEQYLKSGIMGTYSDVYALGATLYFLLTGKVPPSAMERLAGEELTPPENLKQINQNVNDAVMRAMGLKRDLRLQTLNSLKLSLLEEPNIVSVKPLVTPVGNLQPNLSQTRLRNTYCLQERLFIVTDVYGLLKAVEAAEVGDRIKLQSGVYQLARPLIINKPIEIIGQGFNATSILGDQPDYVLNFTGNFERVIRNVEFVRIGEQLANVVEVGGGVTEFRDCIFSGAVGGYRPLQNKHPIHQWVARTNFPTFLSLSSVEVGGYGLIASNGARVQAIRCSFKDNQLGNCAQDVSSEIL